MAHARELSLREKVTRVAAAGILAVGLGMLGIKAVLASYDPLVDKNTPISAPLPPHLIPTPTTTPTPYPHMLPDGPIRLA